MLARRSVTDLPTSFIAVTALLLLLKWKIPEPLLILAGAVGMALAR